MAAATPRRLLDFVPPLMPPDLEKALAFREAVSENCDSAGPPMLNNTVRTSTGWGA